MILKRKFIETRQKVHFYKRMNTDTRRIILLKKSAKRISGLLRSKGKGSLLEKECKTIVTLFAAKKRGKNRTRRGTLQTAPGRNYKLGALATKCPPDILGASRPSCKVPRNCQRLVFGILFKGQNRYYPFVTPSVAEGSSAANPLFYTPSARFLHFGRNDKWSVLFNSSDSLPAREVVAGWWLRRRDTVESVPPPCGFRLGLLAAKGRSSVLLSFSKE